ncbi:hypothetical protein [Saccharothrix sp. Mg75]|uniref:hypothetical protein n=1 Tax=Saccharothrix sp. Mg75 TaxID=3445357 RepID=UPI003EEB9691
MRTVIRFIAASAVSLPLLIGAAGIASADPGTHTEHENYTVAASSEGSFVHEVEAGAYDDDVAYFHEGFVGAGSEGAGYYEVSAVSYPGGAHYEDEYAFAGPHGAVVGGAESSADSGDWDDEGWDD